MAIRNALSELLARTGKWIVDRGLPEGDLGVAEEFPDMEIQKLTMGKSTALGRIQHLKPVLSMSETPPYWERPPAALGSHRPEWPRRSSRTGA